MQGTAVIYNFATAYKMVQRPTENCAVVFIDFLIQVPDVSMCCVEHIIIQRFDFFCQAKIKVYLQVITNINDTLPRKQPVPIGSFENFL